MDKQLAEAWGSFLAGYPWDWFVTLTFREPVVSFRAHRLFHSFCCDIDRIAGTPIGWFRADEYGPRGGRLHIHALMLNVAHLRRLSLMDKWQKLAGYARILPFDPDKGAAYYCAKYVTKTFGDWDVSDNLSAFRQYQSVLPLSARVSGRAQRDRGGGKRRHSKASEEQPAPTVRRRRPKRLNCCERDWEEEMLRRGRSADPAALRLAEHNTE